MRQCVYIKTKESILVSEQSIVSHPLCDRGPVCPQRHVRQRACHPSQMSRHLCQIQVKFDIIYAIRVNFAVLYAILCAIKVSLQRCHPRSQSDEPSVLPSKVSQTSLQRFHPSQESRRLCPIDKLLYFGVPTLSFVRWGVPSVLVITVTNFGVCGEV